MERTEADVAVIGSGVGGMCAAALLARAGYRTIVLESLAFLGGRYSCIGSSVPSLGSISIIPRIR